MADKQSGKLTKARVRRILVPLDGSGFGEAAIPYVEELAGAVGAEVTLLQSVTPHHFEIDLAETRSPHLSKLSEEYLEHAKTTAGDYLATIQKRLSENRIVAHCVVEVGPPAERIVACAKEKEIDLIALSTHGRSGLSAIMMGSVANKVLHLAEVPILLVKPRQ
jgi:nucleotide-binding universal stress UspA family protein